MKRYFTIITFAALLFTSLNVSAQVKSYISLFGGMSNPQGNYGSTSYSNNQSGFAKKGVTFGIDGAVYVYKNLGIGYTFSFQDQGKLNYTDTYNLAQNYTTSYNATSTTVNAYDRFHNFNLMVGPQYSFTYSKFILDIRAFGGLVDVTSTPETQVELLGVPQQSAYFYQRRSHGILLGYGASGGIRYKLSDNLSIGVKVAYIASPGPKVTTDGRTENLGRYVTSLPVNELQTTLGLSLNFK